MNPRPVSYTQFHRPELQFYCNATAMPRLGWTQALMPATGHPHAARQAARKKPMSGGTNLNREVEDELDLPPQGDAQV